MKRQLMHAAAAAFIAAMAGPALADASSGAAFRNIVISLTDLDPDDGIAPSLGFEFRGPSYATSATEGRGDVYDTFVKFHYAGHQDGLLTAATSTDWSSSMGSVAMASSLAGFTEMSATGAAYSGLDGWGTYSSLATGSAFDNQFILSANTRMTISVETDMWSRTTMGYNLDADMAEFATSHVLLNVLGTVNGEFTSDAEERFVDAAFDVRDDNTTIGVSNAWSGLLSVDFVNDSDAQATGLLQTFVRAEGYSALWDGVTPVPEPATYGMLLGGLAILGMVARRRRQ